MHSSQKLATPAPSAHEGTSLSGLTGADALFDTLLEGIVSQLGSTQPGVCAKQLRTGLSAFRPRFEAIYRGVLREHLGADLTALLKELSEPKVRAYFEARRSMGPELGRLLQELSFEMGKTQV